MQFSCVLISSALSLMPIESPMLMIPVDSPPPSNPQDSHHATDIESISMDDLIERLPLAGHEAILNRETDEWVVDPAVEEIARRLASGINLSDQQWRRALLHCGAIRYHKHWVREEIYGLSLTVPDWLGLSQIRLEPKLTELDGIIAGDLFQPICGTCSMSMHHAARFGMGLGIIPDGTDSIELHVEVERGKYLGNDPDLPAPGMLWEGEIEIPISWVDSLDEVHIADDSPELRAAIRDAIGAGFRDWADAPEEIPFVLIDPDCERFPICKTTGLNIHVELLDGDDVIAECILLANDSDSLNLMSSIRTTSPRFYCSGNFSILDDESDPENWVLSLKGISDHVRIIWHADRRWSGTMLIPWSEAVAHEKKRTEKADRGPEMTTLRLRVP